MGKQLSDYGLLALGTQLKKVSDRLLKDVDDIYKSMGSPLSARWVPLLLLIKDNGQLSVSELAQQLGQTHSAVSQLSRKLLMDEWIFDAPDPQDDRRRMLSLTPKGYEALDRLEKSLTYIRQQLNMLLDGKGDRFIQMLSQLDNSLQEQSLSYRVLSVIQDSVVEKVKVVEFSPQFATAFRQLNFEWLEKYFYVEAIDEEILSHPEKYIIEPGGQIFVALVDDQPVGTVALIAVGEHSFELSKMSVTQNMQGKGIGRRLLNRAIRHFRESGRSRLFLESNSKLKPALRLYQSVGFVRQPKADGESHYQRADVYMEYQAPLMGASG